MCRKCLKKVNGVDRWRRNKKVAVAYKGGKCEMCGYDKCMGALDFHHRDPATKDPQWRKLRCRHPDNIKEELDKCTLVCKNCHAEIHEKMY